MAGKYFLKRILLFLLTIIIVSCRSKDAKDESSEYKKYRFDTRVIQKLPVYDSLVSAIIENYPAFKQFIKADDAYKSFRYVPGSKDAVKKIPAAVTQKIDHYFMTLGSDFISSFTFYTDSSVKINIRSTPSRTTPVDIEENLSYYHLPANMHHREYPLRDSVLSEHWQYWARFNKQGLFNF